MNIGEKSRNLMFRIVSKINNNSILKQFKHIELLNSDYDLLKQNKENQLKKLLTEAIDETDYYSKISKEAKLSDFPVITRKILINNYDLLLSKAFKRNELVRVNTSGSSGNPITFLLSKEKRARQLAEVMYYGELCGFKVGVKHAYIRAVKNSNPAINFIKNQVIMNPKNLNTSWLEKQRLKLKQGGMTVLFGHPTSLKVLCQFCKEKGDDPTNFNLQSVISFAEPLTEETKQLIKSTICKNVYNRYSTSELGVLGQECDYGNFHLNHASYVFETLKLHSDENAEYGELGRLVVTDLYSHSMPLIRYEIGDTGVLKTNCECGKKGVILSKLEGRLGEFVTNTEGTPLSPLVINNEMKGLNNVIQYQFIQKDKSKYLLRLVVDEQFKSEEIVKKRLTNLLGKYADLKIQYLGDIPAQKTGKRPYIINEMTK